MEYFKLIINGKVEHDYLFDAGDEAAFVMELAEELEKGFPEVTRVELALVEG